MSVPLLAVDVKESDYEWQSAETPESVQSAPPPPAPTPAKSTFYCTDENGELVEAGEFFRRRFDTLLATPGWLEEQQRKREEAKQEKQRRREERLAAKRQRKEAA